MFAAALAVIALAVGAPLPPAPARWVDDQAGFLSAERRSAIDTELAAYEHATGHQVVVWIGKSLDGAPLDDFAVRTFAAWQVGRKGHDDGLVIFVLAADRKIDIEVGYGLEAVVPDAIAKRIIDDVMVPRIRAGDRDGAIAAGVDAVLAAIEGHPWQGAGATTPPAAAGPTIAEIIGGAILLVLVILLAITHPRTFLWIFAFAFGRGGNGGLGGGGGWSGGGGRSGGGGARGGW